MPADIIAASDRTYVKNGTCVVSCLPTGNYKTLETSVNTNILISDIESRYIDRFDDVSYYTLGDLADELIVGG